MVTLYKASTNSSLELIQHYSQGRQQSEVVVPEVAVAEPGSAEEGRAGEGAREAGPAPNQEGISQR